MPATEITLDQLAGDLHARAERLRDTLPLVEYLKSIAIADLQQGIDEGVDVDGQAFAPLAFSRPGGGTTPLLDSGALRASLAGGPGHVEEVDAGGFVIGTNRPGASIINFGGTIVPRNATWLAIPKTFAAQAAGSPRDFPGKLSFRFGPRGGVMVDRAGTVHYVLTKSTTHPARQFVGAGQRLVEKLRAAIVAYLGGQSGTPNGGP